jgi:hypothetical protein
MLDQVIERSHFAIGRKAYQGYVSPIDQVLCLRSGISPRLDFRDAGNHHSHQDDSHNQRRMTSSDQPFLSDHRTLLSVSEAFILIFLCFDKGLNMISEQSMCQTGP